MRFAGAGVFTFLASKIGWRSSLQRTETSLMKKARRAGGGINEGRRRQQKIERRNGWRENKDIGKREEDKDEGRLLL